VLDCHAGKMVRCSAVTSVRADRHCFGIAVPSDAEHVRHRMATQTVVTSMEQRPFVTSDIDVFGLTHQGRVRKTNADHFLIGTFHRSLRVRYTSIGEGIGPAETESRGLIALVADGVGNLGTAAEGSAKALATVAQHLLHASEICSTMAMSQEEFAIDQLKQSFGAAHKALRDQAQESGTPASATTLTLLAAFWPRAFVVHVGDSRVYRLRGTEFRRFTTDQTVA